MRELRTTHNAKNEGIGVLYDSIVIVKIIVEDSFNHYQIGPIHVLLLPNSTCPPYNTEMITSLPN